MQTTGSWRRRIGAGLTLTALAATGTGVAFGDNVFSSTQDVANGVGVGGMVRVTTGTDFEIPYWLDQTGPTCDATPSSPLTVTLSPPTGVTATPSSFQLTACGSKDVNAQQVTFRVASPGKYDVPAPDVSKDGVNANAAAFKIDAGSPVVGPPPGPTVVAPTVTLTGEAPAANAHGWRNGDVTVTWTVTDGGGTLGTSDDCGATTSTASPYTYTKVVGESATAEGTTLTCLATNSAGSDSETTTVKVDETVPTAWTTGFSAAQVFPITAPPAPGCDQQDALSGIDAPAALQPITGLTSNGVGTATVACTGATDKAGNAAAPASSTYRVTYFGAAGAGCILQPINCDSTSVFSRGKSVPVKFRLPGDGAGTSFPSGFDRSGWTVKRSRSTSCTIDGTVNEARPATTESLNGGIRYDAAADQYVFNLDLRKEETGTCWKVSVELDSGEVLSSSVFKVTR